MREMFTLCLMLFAHVYDDYYKQGILASMKQKSWWNSNSPERMYRFDYIAALVAHSFSWAFTVTLPLFVLFMASFDAETYCVALAINMIVHCFVDDLKANRKKINLVTDQLIHILQIVLTWFYFAL